MVTSRCVVQRWYDALSAHELLRWFLSFRQAIAHTQQDRMMDEPDQTDGSARVEGMFWHARTVETGSGITFHGTRGDITDQGAHSGRARTVKSVDVTDLDAGSHKRDFDLELTTIDREFQTSVYRDRGASSDPVIPNTERPRLTSFRV